MLKMRGSIRIVSIFASLFLSLASGAAPGLDDLIGDLGQLLTPKFNVGVDTKLRIEATINGLKEFSIALTNATDSIEKAAEKLDPTGAKTIFLAFLRQLNETKNIEISLAAV